MSEAIDYDAESAYGQEPERHLSKLDLAHRLKRGVRTIERWMDRGTIPYYKTGRRVTFLYSEVKDALRGKFLVLPTSSSKRRRSHVN